mmetsp:Transcript_27712/g.69437  ORF Transcript_27712/g.69437 Transcript_27712/m.69437 type:complete len:256 (-) Transcript_27712:255-1022(-)
MSLVQQALDERVVVVPRPQLEELLQLPVQRAVLLGHLALLLQLIQLVINREFPLPVSIVQSAIVYFQNFQLQLSERLGVLVSELHFRYERLRIVLPLCLELPALGHVPRTTFRMDGRAHHRLLSGLSASLFGIRLPCLAVLLYNRLGEALCHVRQRVVGSVDVRGKVVRRALLRSFGPNVVGNVNPVAHAIHLNRLQKQKLLVSPPVGAEDGEVQLVHDMVRVKVLVQTNFDTHRKTFQAQVEVRALGTFDSICS